jgi:putative ABC transport system permease protein
MSAVLSKALTDLRRRRTQAAAVLLTVLLAAATATLVLNLLAQTSHGGLGGARPTVAVMLLAAGGIALAATAAVVVDLVGGIVVAARREVGVLRAIGCTPGQVVAIFVLRMLTPAAAGGAAGALGGVLLSRALGFGAWQSLGRPPHLHVAALLAVLAAAGTLALVALAAALPARWVACVPVVRALRSE